MCVQVNAYVHTYFYICRYTFQHTKQGDLRRLLLSRDDKNVCVCVYIYMNVYIHTYIYIYDMQVHIPTHKTGRLAEAPAAKTCVCI